jgi:ElaB/YqjD/DUF883 family membrane-anchored ribosome-binding protein
MADMTTNLKDAAYITVGLGVLGFQKAQVRRVELTKQVEEQRKQLEAQLAEVTKALTEATSKVSEATTARLTALARTLEGQLAELTTLLHTLAQRVDARTVPVRTRVEDSFDAIEQMLPEPTRAIVQQARATAKETESQVRARLGLASAAA